MVAGECLGHSLANFRGTTLEALRDVPGLAVTLGLAKTDPMHRLPSSPGVRRSPSAAPSRPATRSRDHMVAAVLWTLAFAVLALAAACADRAGPGALASARDSADVEILEYTLEDIEAAPLYVPAASPDLTIDGSAGELDARFGRVSAVASLSDGTIVVADAADFGLRFFAPDGTYLRTVGNPGSVFVGPGSFAAPAAWAVSAGDTIRVWDPPQRHLTAFADRGNTITSTLIRPATAGYEYLGSYGDGSALFRYGTSMESLYAAALAAAGRGAGAFTDPDELYVLMRPSAEDTWTTDTVLRRPAPARGDGLWLARASGAIHPEGLWFASGDAPEIRQYDRTGALTRIARWPESDRVVTPDLIGAFVDSQTEGLPSDSARALSASLYELPKSDHFPSTGVIRSAPDGRVWVPRFELPSEDLSGEVLVFDRRGRLEARVEGLPASDGSGPVRSDSEGPIILAPPSLQTMLAVVADSTGFLVRRYPLQTIER